MAKTKKWEEVATIAIMPSASGEFEIRFRLIEGEKGFLFDIRKFANTKTFSGWTKDGVTVKVEDLPAVLEAMQNVVEATKGE